MSKDYPDILIVDRELLRPYNYMTNEQIIRKKCIEANPEIVELKFGCEIETKKWSYNFPQAVITNLSYGNDHKDITYFCGGRDGGIRKEDIDKIIGRPIQLADVLMAIDKANEGKKTKHVVSTKGDIVACINHTLIISTDKWNLKEPLSGQSEPTQKFIAELLKENV